MFEHELLVTWNDPLEIRRASSLWDNFCRSAFNISSRLGMSWDETLDEVLLGYGAIKNGGYLYFASEEERTMFVLKWS